MACASTNPPDCCLLLIAGCVGPAASPARAALSFYGERLAFDTDNPGLPVEGFEEGVPDTNFDSPLDATTNNAVFSPGDILPGITIQTVSPGGFDLRVIQLPTTRILATPSTLRVIEILFSPGIPAVGFDVFQFNDAGDVTIEIFGAGGSLGQTTVATDAANGAFFGVVSDADAIVRITVDDSAIVPAIDDVAFGTPDPPLLVFFGDRLDFDGGFPGLPTETFEEGVPDTNFDSPLDATTNNAVFSPGDILPGLTIQTDAPGNLDLRVTQLPTTRILATPSTLRMIEILFAPAVPAAGFDVFQFNDAGDVRIDVFGPGDALLGRTQLLTGPAGSFFGVASPGPGITRIAIDDTAIVPAIDDVAFAPAPPATLLRGAALVAVAGLLRRRRRAQRP